MEVPVEGLGDEVLVFFSEECIGVSFGRNLCHKWYPPVGSNLGHESCLAIKMFSRSPGLFVSGGRDSFFSHLF